ncbi:unnamed protein product [Blepharisma stoltei]|uniref:Uncharacterized protein n=1 Tax=Blepharisma stoltei TaxID=1481888 RepID=A0AAU9ICS8_9CILI|nr:unnamed protein product [Blepharisma stoltei]
MEDELSSPRDIEIDGRQLRSVLGSISNQLIVPFLERRGRSNMHKDNPLDELRDVIQELTERERELQACIGIATMLLDNNDTLNSRLKEYKLKKAIQKDKARLLNIEINRYKEELLTSEEKYEQVNGALIKCEEQLLIITAENKRVLNESCKLKELPDTLMISVKNYESEIEELKLSFRKQLDEMHRTKFELERKLKRSFEEKNKMENQLQEVKEEYEKLDKKHCICMQKLKDLEGELEKCKDDKNEIEKKYEIMAIKFEKIRSQNEKLEEDLNVIENMNINRKANSRRQSRHMSLLNELECIENENGFETLEECEIEEKPSPSPSNGNYRIERSKTTTTRPEPKYQKGFISIASNGKESFIFGKEKLCSIVNEGSVIIEGKKEKITRKDPAEEYFLLTTQTVKMNSPYMETICIIPAQTLYQKAIRDNIPFHKWHVWVESELNSAYIQSLYNTDTISSKAPKQKDKKRSIFPF